MGLRPRAPRHASRGDVMQAGRFAAPFAGGPRAARGPEPIRRKVQAPTPRRGRIRAGGDPVVRPACIVTAINSTRPRLRRFTARLRTPDLGTPAWQPVISDRRD